METTINTKLNLNEHFTSLCKATSKKIMLFNTTSKLRQPEMRRFTLNCLMTSQLLKYPVIFIVSQLGNEYTNSKRYARALRIVCKEYKYTLQELLNKVKSLTIQLGSLKSLKPEMYNVEA